MALGPGYDVSTSRLDIQYRQEIQLNVSVSNNGGEPAYSAELQVNIDPAFAYVGRSDDVRDIHCDFRGVGLGVLCRFVLIFLCLESDATSVSLKANSPINLENVDVEKSFNDLIFSIAPFNLTRKITLNCDCSPGEFSSIALHELFSSNHKWQYQNQVF